MVEGRLRKYYEDVVLMEQKFIVNDTINVKVSHLRKWLPGFAVNSMTYAKFLNSIGINLYQPD